MKFPEEKVELLQHEEMDRGRPRSLVYSQGLHEEKVGARTRETILNKKKTEGNPGQCGFLQSHGRKDRIANR